VCFFIDAPTGRPSIHALTIMGRASMRRVSLHLGSIFSGRTSLFPADCLMGSVIECYIPTPKNPCDAKAIVALGGIFAGLYPFAQPPSRKVPVSANALMRGPPFLGARPQRVRGYAEFFGGFFGANNVSIVLTTHYAASSSAVSALMRCAMMASWCWCSLTLSEPIYGQMPIRTD